MLFWHILHFTADLQTSVFTKEDILKNDLTTFVHTVFKTILNPTDFLYVLQPQEYLFVKMPSFFKLAPVCPLLNHFTWLVPYSSLSLVYRGKDHLPHNVDKLNWFLSQCRVVLSGSVSWMGCRGRAWGGRRGEAGDVDAPFLAKPHEWAAQWICLKVSTASPFACFSKSAWP